MIRQPSSQPSSPASPPQQPSRRHPDALFVGLCTLDVIQLVDHVPAANEKLTALRQTVAAGGPATNAAVLHAQLGGRATLLTGIGRHPLAAGVVTAELNGFGIKVIDQDSGRSEPPTVSTILVSRATGERAVASVNATGSVLAPPDDLSTLLQGKRAVLLDGHHLDLARAVATAARGLGIPVILDGGSYKSGTDRLVELVDVAACSADFHPPGCDDTEATFTWLRDHGVRWTAVTDGPAPIRWQGPDSSGSFPPPPSEVADTLGAGDFFHGALTYQIAAAPHLDSETFPSALVFAAVLAGRSCASFGTRQWLSQFQQPRAPQP